MFHSVSNQVRFADFQTLQIAIDHSKDVYSGLKRHLVYNFNPLAQSAAQLAICYRIVQTPQEQSDT